MKINENILSLPPYISTTWHHISAIMMKGPNLLVTLRDGDSILIPGLASEIIDLIFNMHALHIEKKCCQQLPSKPTLLDADKKQLSILSQSIFKEEREGVPSLKFGFATFDGLNTMMQHNPSEMNAPDLPTVILEKIGAIAKIIAPQETDSLPQDIPGCNCFHCQITRAINQNTEAYTEVINHEEEEEMVSDKDLQFNQWDVKPIGDKLFHVTNKLDDSEQYRVFLGSPIGCNCGGLNCEHIVAALRA